ncbi:DUF3857 domain-containing protein [Paraflavitalea pollutisoli]|uniref:DUF3857 domain-containing protein n=1 Tax=Paraflavitalea pollutisoli TaxID=3034143 RepID=UPI0023EC230E|nr:DUF3857 domain-containing protein [Paraflavitalea sp. H1-2-19X]
MRKTITLIALMGLAVPVLAQRDKDIPAFGTVEKADLLARECDFDKEAEAVVLFDAAEAYADMMGQIELVRHIRIKILKDKGLKAADIRIPYFSYRNDESIKGLTAQTYNLDAGGNVVATKVDKKLIYEKALNKYNSEQVFTFPDVKAGSIIEYKYTHSNLGLASWYFQRSIPVKYSRYRVDLPEEIEFTCNALAVLPVEQKTENKGRRTVKTMSMTNVPALRDEPFITCEDDYLQRIETKLIAVNNPGMPRRSLLLNWPQVIKALAEDENFGVQMKRDIPRTTELDSMLKKQPDPYQRMSTVHQYVRKNMEWNNIRGIGAFDGVRAAWKDKKGTSGEINLILVNLLKDAGLKASPLLVSTRDNGRVNTSFASSRVFNKVVAHVTIGEQVYVLDATEKYTPSNLIPYDLMYSEGLAIEKIDTWAWGWKVLWDQKPHFRETIILRANIDEQGVMNGNASVTSYDYSRVNRMPTLKLGKDKFIEKFFTSTNAGVKIDSIAIENEAIDSLPLNQSFAFTQPVNSSGDYRYFSVNLFTGLEKNPFVADNRFSDVFFGTNQNYQIVANVTIPESYEFETLPKSVRMIMPDTSISITRRVNAEKNVMAVRISLEFSKPFYTPEEYPDFKEFYKQLYALLNEQYAIRKKAKS